jgi:hypothetical protein
MKIRMELTEASVTEDITPFERERLREALEEEVRRQLPADRRLVRVVDWDPGGGHAVENAPGMRQYRVTRRKRAIRATRLVVSDAGSSRFAADGCSWVRAPTCGGQSDGSARASLHRGLASGPGRRRPLLAVEDRARSYGASRAAPYRRDPVPRLRRPPHRDSTFFRCAPSAANVSKRCGRSCSLKPAPKCIARASKTSRRSLSALRTWPHLRTPTSTVDPGWPPLSGVLSPARCSTVEARLFNLCSRGLTTQSAGRRGHILATLGHELQIAPVKYCDVFLQLDHDSRG